MGARVIVILGPTCSGKTILAIDIAKRIDSEIISADSRQVFKYLDIGTAKPTKDQLGEIKHYFINELNPDEDFNVSKFENKAIKIIKELHRQNKIPVVVGGSGLYIKALVDGIFDSVDADEELRKNLLDKKNKYGNQFLYDELKKVDPVSADKMLPQNWKRVIRALEVFYYTGEPIWKAQAEHKREIDFEFHQFGLEWQRKILYHNIENRVDEMMSLGFVDEVKDILAKRYKPELNALNTVGYKEIISYLNNEITLERAVELIKRNTRRFAKRQMTWFRKDSRIKWNKISSEEELMNLADEIQIQIANN